MSLINKMLQDLDARGGAAGDPAQLVSIKPVPRDERRPPGLLAGGALGLLAVLAAAGWLGWRYARAPAAPVAPAPVRASVVVAAPAPPSVVVAAPAPPPVPSPSLPAPLAKAPAVVTAIKAVPDTPKAKRAAKPAPAAQPPAKAAPRAPLDSGRQVTAEQGAERAYRRALASLQEGRVAEALAGLEQALQIEPRHEAARQTLIGLLIENKRPDEAMRQLQQGLELEPRQPSMAMLLARLQIERGGNGIDTLMRSLPYAAGNSDYHAFLGGALQRQQRHREAGEQYQAALRGMPQNGVWLMGLGISLLADKRNAEALEAFRRAKASGGLAPELQAFVERKLQQLAP